METPCPACNQIGIEYNSEQIELPYLGESMETMMRCLACGWRHTDFILTDMKEPTRHMMMVTEEDDMMVRVVRASSGTIRIPELGVTVEPGVASDAFITNIEGILVRIEGILKQLYNDADEDEPRAKIEALQQVMQDMRVGKAAPVQVIIEDPHGNSAILGPKAITEPISAEEASKLKVGAFVMDQSNFEASDESE
jgi:zinc finger protein